MPRLLYLLLGWLAIGLGGVGVVVPLLPTVPFIILAAFFFAKGSPKLEAWLIEHPVFGSHIRSWRERRAISTRGKRSAQVAFAISAAVGLLMLEFPWALLPLAAAIGGGLWIHNRPTA